VITREEYERLLEEARKKHPEAEVALAFDDDFLKHPVEKHTRAFPSYDEAV